MPLKIGDSQSSRNLIPQVKYKHAPSGLDRDTRAEETAVQWSISVSGDVTYLIKFSANFFKKHLHTSTKKLANVQMEYDKLAIADDDARWTAAQEAADQTKFLKQLKHRSGDEQKCSACGHPINDHKNSGPCTRITKSIGLTGGIGKNGKPARGEISTACTCPGYSPPYAEKRGLQGKPTPNPLLGATAQTNDIIWMDKIPRATFEKVIQMAIQQRFNAVMPAPGWNGAGEHIEWDFGAVNQGCILKIDANTKIADAKAKGYRSVEVTMTLDNKDPKKPIFTACHLDGKKTK